MLIMLCAMFLCAGCSSLCDASAGVVALVQLDQNLALIEVQPLQDMFIALRKELDNVKTVENIKSIIEVMNKNLVSSMALTRKQAIRSAARSYVHDLLTKAVSLGSTLNDADKSALFALLAGLDSRLREYDKALVTNDEEYKTLWSRIHSALFVL